MTEKTSSKFRPHCSGIDPDADEKGYFCKTCGYELLIRGSWFRHGDQWQHPEVWTGR